VLEVAATNTDQVDAFCADLQLWKCEENVVFMGCDILLCNKTPAKWHNLSFLLNISVSIFFFAISK
jgi:hypothetical protein